MMGFQRPFLTVAAILLVAAEGQGQVFQELYSFGRNPDGNVPMGELVEGDDGNFYGTTYYGGPSDCGTIFKITPSGTLTIIASLDGSWGRNPCYSLVKASDGNFYGTTFDGAVFRVTPSGALTHVNSTVAPAGSFIQGTDGYIYGALAVNSSAYGYVFHCSLDWTTGAFSMNSRGIAPRRTVSTVRAGLSKDVTESFTEPLPKGVPTVMERFTV